MRLIGLLVAMLAVGWLVKTQLQSTPTTALSAEQAPAGVPTQAPRNAEELKAFEAQINSLADQQNAETRKALEQIE